jgi:zinc transporter
MVFVPLSSLIDPDKVPSDGILFAWNINQNGTGSEISPEDVTDALLNSNQAIWLHLNFSNTRVMRWLQASQLMPDELAESIHNDTGVVGYDAITELKQGVLFHLQDFTLDFGQAAKSNNVDFESFWCYLTPTLLITGRLHPLTTLDQAKDQLIRGRILPNSVHSLFHQIIDIRSVQLKAAIRRLADRIDALEEIILSGNDLAANESIGTLRIQCNRIRRHFSAELDALSHLRKKNTAAFSHDDLEQLHEHTNELTSFLLQIDSLYIRAKVLQDEQTAHVAELNAKQLQVLSVMTVIFLPMTLISGIMGMNMEDLPGLKGSFTEVMVMMGLAGFLVYVGLKLKRII